MFLFSFPEGEKKKTVLESSQKEMARMLYFNSCLLPNKQSFFNLRTLVEVLVSFLKTQLQVSVVYTNNIYFTAKQISFKLQLCLFLCGF